MQITLLPVILCGGAGSRLWPLSRTGFPKQFLCLADSDSLFQSTVLRLLNNDWGKIALTDLMVISNEEHRFLIQEQLREKEINSSKIILETEGRNTAPALTLAALEATHKGQDPILIVSPADQIIKSQEQFFRSIKHAIELANDNQIVIFGVPPESPNTGYGYINVDQQTEKNSCIYEVKSFEEKPNKKVAERYLKEGNYFWNAGLFVLKSSQWLAAIKRFSPAIFESTKLAWELRKTDNSFVRPGSNEFKLVPSNSIDYAVMEHCPGVFPIKMVKLDAGWDDLGSWDAVWQTSDKDELGNACIGDVLISQSKNNLICANTRLVSLVDVNDIVVIETSDAVLVANKSSSQNVKKVVEKLIADEREERNLHRKVHRPWGWYDSIDQGTRFKVKRIQVKPGASLSLQKHHHRAEHWIVVKGTAEVTCGQKKLTLTENQSTYIPLGEVHRLSNPGDIPTEIIEVQSGDYLGEDDIVRFDDEYGRDSE